MADEILPDIVAPQELKLYFGQHWVYERDK